MTRDELRILLYSLHHSTFRNYRQIIASKKCGCFYCESIFSPDEIDEWCDNDGKGDMTAICPYCGIDSVLGDGDGVEVTPEILGLMNRVFFGSGFEKLDISGLTDDENKNNVIQP